MTVIFRDLLYLFACLISFIKTDILVFIFKKSFAIYFCRKTYILFLKLFEVCRIPVTFHETISDIYARCRTANPNEVNQSNNYARHDKCQYCTSSNEDGLV